MTERISPLITAIELLKLYETEKCIPVDVSFGKNAFTNYREKHLKGAVFFDLNTELAAIKSDVSVGGRHPLPDVRKFAETLTHKGIENGSNVVVYDDNNGSNAAARLWWMLKAAGHQKVQVLNGGLKEAIKAGCLITDEITLPEQSKPYFIKEWELPLADMDEVEKVSEDKNYCVIDVRDAYRYKGESEPIDLVAGHIPGAINIPYTGNLDQNGLFLNQELLKEKYLNIIKDKPGSKIIVHCGSGVTACHTLLAMDYAGLPIPKLYVGSWSEWSRNNKPIAKG